MNPNFVSDVAKRHLTVALYTLGVSIWRRPVLWITFGFILTFIAGLGIVNFRYEDDYVELYSPASATEHRGYELLTHGFDLSGREAFRIIVSVKESAHTGGDYGDNILTVDVMKESFFLFEEMLTFEWNNLTYADFCVETYQNSHQCESLTTSLFSMAENSTVFFASDDVMLYILNQQQSYSAFYEFWFGTELWNFQPNVNNTIRYAKAIFMWFSISDTRNPNEKEIFEYQKHLMDYLIQIEDDFQLIKYSMYSQPLVNLESRRLLENNAMYWLLTICIIVISCSIMLGRWSCDKKSIESCQFLVDLRVSLGLSVFVSIVMSLVIGLGISSLYIPFSPVSALVPFVLFGIGCDDMLIITDTFESIVCAQAARGTLHADRYHHYFGMALKHSGVSITLTTFSSVFALLFGAIFTSTPALQYFCYFSMWCFAADYFIQLFVFSSLLVLDTKRIMQKRNCLICCIKHSRSSAKSHDNQTDGEIQKTVPQPTPTPIVLVLDNTVSISATAEDSEKDAQHVQLETYHTRFDSGPDEEIEPTLKSNTLSTRFLKKFVVYPILLNQCWRKVVLLSDVLAIVASVYVFAKYATTDVSETIYYSFDSPIKDYVNDLSNYLSPSKSLHIDSWILVNTDMSVTSLRHDTIAMINEINNLTEISAIPLNNWVFDYERWYNESVCSKNTSDSVTDFDNHFYSLLSTFLNESEFKHYADNILVNDENTKIVASVFSGYAYTVRPFADHWGKYYRTYQNIAKRYGYRYAYEIPFFEANLYSDKIENFDELLSTSKSGYRESITNGKPTVYRFNGYMLNAEYGSQIIFLIAATIVFAFISVIVVLFVLSDVLALLIAVVILISIMLNVVGITVVFGLAFQAIVYIAYVMSIGLTVDFVIHMLNSMFSEHCSSETSEISDDEWYKTQLLHSFDAMGGSILKGGMTTLLGVCMLAFCDSLAWRYFFIIFVSVIIISLWHGLVVAPALVGEMKCLVRSWIDHGPKRRDLINDVSAVSNATERSKKNDVDQ